MMPAGRATLGSHGAFPAERELAFATEREAHGGVRGRLKVFARQRQPFAEMRDVAAGGAGELG